MFYSPIKKIERFPLSQEHEKVFSPDQGTWNVLLSDQEHKHYRENGDKWGQVSIHMET